VGNRLWVTETLTQTTRVISNTYAPLNRLTGSAYSTSEQFAYVYDAVGNRTLVTSTTPLSGTVVTTYTFDAANRLTDRARSDDRTYTYDWSARGQMLTEWTEGLPVRTFDYDGAGRMVEATVFTLTTRFTYNGDGARRVVEVVGQGTTTYTLDYGRGNRILAEETITGAITYLYGHDCLGQYDSAEDEWLYYLNDATGYVRQGADEQGEVVSSWLFDPDGTVLEGPEGLVSHLICGGVYDWSTGLIFKGGRYFDPSLGIWLALVPLVVIQSWRGRKRRRRGFPWYVVVLVIVGVGGVLTACGKGTPTPEGDIPALEEACTDTPELPTPMPTPLPPTETPLPPGYRTVAIEASGQQLTVAYPYQDYLDPISGAEWSTLSQEEVGFRLVLGEVGTGRLLKNQYALAEGVGIVYTVYNRLNPAVYDPQEKGVWPYAGCGSGGNFVSCATASIEGDYQYDAMGTDAALNPRSVLTANPFFGTYGEEKLAEAADVAFAAYYLAASQVVSDPTGGAVEFAHNPPSTGPAIFYASTEYLPDQGYYFHGESYRVPYDAKEIPWDQPPPYRADPLVYVVP
jgi:YD repeat-containing protein